MRVAAAFLVAVVMLLVSHVALGAFGAPMMISGRWLAARMQRWARTGR
jgi:hypothetical protein